MNVQAKPYADEGQQTHDKFLTAPGPKMNCTRPTNDISCANPWENKTR